MEMPRRTELAINRLRIDHTKITQLTIEQRRTFNVPNLQSPTEYQVHNNRMSKLQVPQKKMQMSLKIFLELGLFMYRLIMKFIVLYCKLFYKNKIKIFSTG
jgi:hypothetical protein